MENLITISGPPGSGSSTVAKLLAEKLKLNYFSVGQVYKDLSRGTIKDKYYFLTFKSLCDEANLEIPEFNNLDDSTGTLNLWQTEFGKSKELHNIIDKLQIKLANQGNIIIDSKLSIQMIKNSTKKIWLFADIEERAKRSAERDKISEQEAIKIVSKRQQAERTEWQKIYGIDYFTQENLADLKINTTSLTPEQIAEQIINSL